MKVRFYLHGRGRRRVSYYRDVLEISGVDIVDGLDFDYAIASGYGIGGIYKEFEKAGREPEMDRVMAIANEPSFYAPFLSPAQREEDWFRGVNWWYEPRFFDPRVTSEEYPMSFFVNMSPQEKTKKCSMVSTHGSAYVNIFERDREKISQLGLLYEKRTILAYKTLETSLPIDVYGRGWSFSRLGMYNPKIKGEVKNKPEGLLPYEYSIAIENCVDPLYVSEKLSDCFLCGTVPIYYGTRDVFEMYPFDCLEFLDIYSPTVMDDLARILEKSPTEEKLEQVRLAAEHYHKNYSMQAVVDRLLREKS